MRLAFVGALMISALGERLALAQASYVSDRFDYATNFGGSGTPVPSPWIWAVNGTSTNTLFPDFGDPTHGVILGLSYSGSGWYSLSRNDVAGSNAVYQIQFWDDGSVDLGELFYAIDPNQHFIGIGVNNGVAYGQYYLRTDLNNGNHGTVIPAPRKNPSLKTNWHTFSIYVTPMGAFAGVDGYFPDGNFLDTRITAVSTVNLMGNWSKPAHVAWVDNFQVLPFAPSTIPDGTQVTTDGRIWNPNGSDTLTSLSSNDMLRVLAYGNGAAWRKANPSRYSVIRDAVLEENRGLCGNAARSAYHADGEWCSEFARWVLEYAYNVHNYNYCAYCESVDYCTMQTSLADVTEVKDLEGLYGSFVNGFTPRSKILPSTPKPGDYAAFVSGSTGERNGHSELVVGVSADARYIWTVGGNVTGNDGRGDCVRFHAHDFFVNGSLAWDIDGFGNTDVLINPPNQYRKYSVRLCLLY